MCRVRPMGVLWIQGERKEGQEARRERGKRRRRRLFVCVYARNVQVERHQLGNISIFRYRINGSLPRARRAHKSSQAYHASRSQNLRGLMGCVGCPPPPPYILLYSLASSRSCLTFHLLFSKTEFSIPYHQRLNIDSLMLGYVISDNFMPF